MNATNSLTLKDLPIGIAAVITGMDDPSLLRFQELGLLPGSTLKLLRRAPIVCDPLQIEPCGSLFSIRRREARRILVQPSAPVSSK